MNVSSRDKDREKRGEAECSVVLSPLVVLCRRRG